MAGDQSHGSLPPNATPRSKTDQAKCLTPDLIFVTARVNDANIRQRPGQTILIIGFSTAQRKAAPPPGGCRS
jgi:hypothetical protein